MLIPVLTEPSFRNYLWAKQTMEGIVREAARRKYRVHKLDPETYRSVNYDALFGQGRRMLIVIGTSVTWMPGALAFFTGLGIETVFVSFDPAETALPSGMVRMDYVGATDHLMNYLAQCGRGRVAMYACNPNSSADTIKTRFFLGRMRAEGRGDEAEDSIFPNRADLNACADAFLARADRFDAVICANDIAAVSLMSRLREAGKRVPDDLFVTAFGDSVMAERVSPALTTATLDHRELGKQAVLLFSYLSRMPYTANVSARVQSRLIVRASTASIPDETQPSRFRAAPDASGIDFYSDPVAERLLRAETLLGSADAVDLRLMESLLAGQSIEGLEQELFLTSSALQYRKRQLMNTADCSSAQDFLAFLGLCRGYGLL